MRVLLTVRELAVRAGTQLWVRDVALALRDRGHLPVVFSPVLGEVASEIRRATVPVIDDLAHLAEAPDVVHGQHHVETMAALAAFPGVPALSVSHGWAPEAEAPPAHPRIRRYVAVDDLVRERLVAECGIAPERVAVVRNFVDLRRFHPRSPLPQRPARALALSNAAREESFLPALRAACVARGIALEVAGVGSGRATDRPESLLAGADVVFAKARAALEAAAVGCFVVLCDAAGLGPAITPESVDRLRALNFGARLLTAPVDATAVGDRLAAYDPAAAAAVRDRLRAEVDLEAAVDRLLALYEQAIAEQRAAGPPDLEAELRAYASYLGSGPLRGSRALLHDELERLRAAAALGDGARAERDRVQAERDAARSGAEAVRAGADVLRVERDALRVERDALRRERDALRLGDDALEVERQALQAERQELRAELGWMRETLTWRWRARLLRLPPVGALARWRARRGRRS